MTKIILNYFKRRVNTQIFKNLNHNDMLTSSIEMLNNVKNINYYNLLYLKRLIMNVMNLIIFSSVKRIHSVLLILKQIFYMAEFNYLHAYDSGVVDIKHLI